MSYYDEDPNDNLHRAGIILLAVLVTSIVGGTALKVTPKFGPLAASSLSLVVFAGQYIQFPVQRVWSTGTTATVVGLKSPIIQGGQ